MNASNRFAIETMAREREEDIRRRLRRSGQLDELRPASAPARRKGSFRAALIVAGTVGLSLLLATGLSFSMVFALNLAC